MQKKTLHFLYDNYGSSYESILNHAGKTTVNVNRLRSLCIEIFKTLSNTNPAFMNEVFELRKTNSAVRNQYKLNLDVPIINEVNFGAKIIRYLGPKIWNSLRFHIKSSESLMIRYKTGIRSQANALFVGARVLLLYNGTCPISKEPTIHKFSWLIYLEVFLIG